MKNLKDYLTIGASALILLLVTILPNCNGSKNINKVIKQQQEYINNLQVTIDNQNKIISDYEKDSDSTFTISNKLIDSLNLYIDRYNTMTRKYRAAQREIATLKAEATQEPRIIYIDTCDVLLSSFVSLSRFDSLSTVTDSLKVQVNLCGLQYDYCVERLTEYQKFKLFETSRIFADEGYKTDLVIQLQGQLSDVSVNLVPYNKNVVKETKSKRNLLYGLLGLHTVSDLTSSQAVIGGGYMNEFSNNNYLGVQYQRVLNTNHTISLTYGIKF